MQDCDKLMFGSFVVDFLTLINSKSKVNKKQNNQKELFRSSLSITQNLLSLKVVAPEISTHKPKTGLANFLTLSTSKYKA